MGKYRTIVADPPWPYRDGPLLGFGTERLPSLLPYDTLTVADIAALPVADLAAPAAHIYIWTTNRFIWEAKPIAESWGVKVAQILTWAKAPMGLGPGSAFANTAEFVLFGRFKMGQTISAAREIAGLSRNQVDVELGNVRSKNPDRGTELCRRWEFDDCIPTDTQWDSLRRILPTLSDELDLTPDPQRQRSSWFQFPRGAHSAKPEAFIDLVEQVSPAPYVELFARRQRLGWDTWGNECFNTAGFEVPA